MRPLLAAAVICLMTVPAFAGANHDANQASRDQKHIDSERGFAANAAANAAKNQALGHTAVAARNLANEATHTAKADALLAGCPTCH